MRVAFQIYRENSVWQLVLGQTTLHLGMKKKEKLQIQAQSKIIFKMVKKNFLIAKCTQKNGPPALLLGV